jgi:outer membrane protein OmpA-like peptidoglycan-associated protein
MRPILTLVLALCLSATAILPASHAQAPAGRQFVLFFQEWSAAFDSPARALLADAADYAKPHPDDAVTITGYADPTGTSRANALISALRAELVVDTLIDSGVDAKRISQSAKGSTDFVMSSIESRRVTISVGKQ